jgi:hypothetical protein
MTAIFVTRMITFHTDKFVVGDLIFLVATMHFNTRNERMTVSHDAKRWKSIGLTSKTNNEI